MSVELLSYGCELRVAMVFFYLHHLKIRSHFLLEISFNWMFVEVLGVPIYCLNVLLMIMASFAICIFYSSNRNTEPENIYNLTLPHLIEVCLHF